MIALVLTPRCDLTLLTAYRRTIHAALNLDVVEILQEAMRQELAKEGVHRNLLILTASPKFV